MGETIFLCLNKYAHGTKYDSYDWLDKLKHLSIPDHITEFLKDNWATIDVFELQSDVENMVNNVILYEIKTVNYYATKGVNYGKRPFLTKNSLAFYQMALEKGYSVKSVYIILFDNWNFDVSIQDFDVSDFTIWDGNPKYSKN
ncbi:MAG: hypothetical protein ACOCWQ_02515 [Nanoarchaeota archaeon]